MKKTKNNVEKKYNDAKSKKRGSIGLFEKEYEEKLSQALLKVEKARFELDESIYNALELSKEERQQIEDGLKELQEIRILRTKI